MANVEHLALLQQGTVIWNDWRKRNPVSLPDLRGADLSDADLSGALLSEAFLSSADLSKANLSKANLSRANLSLSLLFEAFLSCANLWAANLSGANLSDTDLSKAILSKANLTIPDPDEIRPRRPILRGEIVEVENWHRELHDIRGWALNRAFNIGFKL
jgi:uncharacterized protein YjbI with pentapeptide repeats